MCKIYLDTKLLVKRYCSSLLLLMCAIRPMDLMFKCSKSFVLVIWLMGSVFFQYAWKGSKFQSKVCSQKWSGYWSHILLPWNLSNNKVCTSLMLCGVLLTPTSVRHDNLYEITSCMHATCLSVTTFLYPLQVQEGMLQLGVCSICLWTQFFHAFILIRN